MSNTVIIPALQSASSLGTLAGMRRPTLPTRDGDAISFTPNNGQTQMMGTIPHSADSAPNAATSAPSVPLVVVDSPEVAAMKAELERLKADNAAMKAKASKPKTLSMKVSEKGGLSVYGLGRFPVTLYVQQWERLLGVIDEVKEFIDANRAILKVKE